MHIGNSVGSAWFMVMSKSSVLGAKITAWTGRKAKKLTEEDKAALLVSNPDYAQDVQVLKDLAVNIHALREQARGLFKKCEDTRLNALMVLPKELT